jgi:hypothetical protein
MQNFASGEAKFCHPFEVLCGFAPWRLCVKTRSRGFRLRSLRRRGKFFALCSLRLKMNLRPAGCADLEIGAPI